MKATYIAQYYNIYMEYVIYRKKVLRDITSVNGKQTISQKRQYAHSSVAVLWSVITANSVTADGVACCMSSTNSKRARLWTPRLSASAGTSGTKARDDVAPPSFPLGDIDIGIISLIEPS